MYLVFPFIPIRYNVACIMRGRQPIGNTRVRVFRQITYVLCLTKVFSDPSVHVFLLGKY